MGNTFPHVFTFLRKAIPMRWKTTNYHLAFVELLTKSLHLLLQLLERFTVVEVGLLDQLFTNGFSQQSL